jgi:hypothetical protein
VKVSGAAATGGVEKRTQRAPRSAPTHYGTPACGMKRGYKRRLSCQIEYTLFGRGKRGNSPVDFSGLFSGKIEGTLFDRIDRNLATRVMDSVMIQTQPHNKVCIFCLRTDDEVKFDREHIIPESIGGTFFMDDMVCKHCNNKLGSEVDCEILKVFDVLKAMDTLQIPYNRNGILRSYYELHLVSEKQQRFRASASDGGLRLLTQDLPDGSRVVLGHDGFENTLKKTLHRDETLIKAGFKPKHIDRLLEEMLVRYKSSDIDEEVRCDELGLVLVKRSDSLQGEIQPKSKANAERVAAKMFFEWMFFCFGNRFVECASWSEKLHSVVYYGSSFPCIHLFRSEPPDSTFRKTHYIYVLVLPAFTKAVVGLFGAIEYTLITPPIDPAVLEELTKTHNISNVIGVAYEQDLEKPAKRFFLLCSDGSSKYLGEI